MLKLILRYIRYRLFARHKHGHGIHSPFVYGLITNVLNDNYRYMVYNEVENIRTAMLRSDKVISVTNHGAGSHIFRERERKIRDIARYSSVNKKFGRLLFRLVQYFKPHTVIELGTGTGVSTIYLAKGCEKTKVVSVEANRELVDVAGQNLLQCRLSNVELINNTFEEALPGILKEIKENTLVFIDGNHEKEATLSYFNGFMKKAKNNLVIILDDINWSEGMREAWSKIKSYPASMITLDLFFMGIVYVNKGMQKQNYLIRF